MVRKAEGAVRGGGRRQRAELARGLEFRLDDRFSGSCVLFQKQGQPLIALRPHHDANCRRAPRHLLALGLGHAARNGDHEVPPCPPSRLLEAPDAPKLGINLFGRLLANMAGVENNEAGILDVTGDGVASRPKRIAHALRIVNVHLAAEGLDENLLGRAAIFFLCGFPHKLNRRSAGFRLLHYLHFRSGGMRTRRQLLHEIAPDARFGKRGKLLAPRERSKRHGLAYGDGHVQGAALQNIPDVAQHIHFAVPRNHRALMPQDRQSVQMGVGNQNRMNHRGGAVAVFVPGAQAGGGKKRASEGQDAVAIAARAFGEKDDVIALGKPLGDLAGLVLHQGTPRTVHKYAAL